MVGSEVSVIRWQISVAVLGPEIPFVKIPMAMVRSEPCVLREVISLAMEGPEVAVVG